MKHQLRAMKEWFDRHEIPCWMDEVAYVVPAEDKTWFLCDLNGVQGRIPPNWTLIELR